MSNILKTFEKATLVSVENISNEPIEKWEWRGNFIGRKSTLLLCESIDTYPHEQFVEFTDITISTSQRAAAR